MAKTSRLISLIRLRGVALGTAMVTIVAIAAAGGVSATLRAAAQPSGTTVSTHVDFDRNGNVRLPIGYKQWEHIGKPATPIDQTVLDGTQIVTLTGAYVEPSAFAYFKKTGQWRDGSRIVNEFRIVKGGNAGVGMMVKSSERFPAEPGNWAYFAFLPNGSKYPSTASVRPRQQCASCHVTLAQKSDYVVLN